MNAYTIQNGKHSFLQTNTFIKLDYIRNSQDFKGVFSNKVINTNIKNTDLFFNRLIDYENKTKKNKNKLVNYGVLFTLMLDKERDIKQLQILTKAFINKFDNLPYYSYIKITNNGYYLVIYISERHYFNTKKRVKTDVKAKKDIYKNKLNNKTCFKRSKNSYLWRKKGEIISSNTKYTYFSNKKRFFRFSNKKHFNKYIYELKKWYINTLKETLKAQINETISFKRFNYSTLSKNKKINAKLWNSAFNDLEKDFLKGYQALKYTDILKENKQAKKDIDNLFIKYNDKLTKNKIYYNENNDFYIPFKIYKNIKFKLNLNTTFKKTKENINLLKLKFNKELKKIIFNYLPPLTSV